MPACIHKDQMFDLGSVRSACFGTDLFLIRSQTTGGKMRTDNGKGDFVDHTLVDLAEIFFSKLN